MEHEAPVLRGDIEADFCIVGGGYTGLWTARRLLSDAPGASVVVVERDICGSGASGRNGGFVIPWWTKLSDLSRLCGDGEAVRLCRASEDAITEVGAFCANEAPDAAFHRGGWLWTATSRAQMGAWTNVLQECERVGATPFTEVTGDEILRRVGFAGQLAGVLCESAATVHPGHLVRGLRTAVVLGGASVFEHSPVTSIDDDKGLVKTPSGSVRAGVIILGMGAWAAKIRELRRAVVPLGSNMIATEPVGEWLSEKGWTAGESVSNSRMMARYMRTTPDARVTFGHAGGALGFAGRVRDGFAFDRKRSAEVTGELRRYIPVESSVRVTHAWGGPVARSVDGLPVIGRASSRRPVLYATGYSGNGIGPSVIAARILASSALGRDDEWSDCPLNQGIRHRFPPEPARFLGGALVRGAVARKERKEDEDREAGRMLRRIANLAPSGYFRPGERSDASFGARRGRRP